MNSLGPGANSETMANLVVKLPVYTTNFPTEEAKIWNDLAKGN